MIIVKGKKYPSTLVKTMQLGVMRKVKTEFGLGWGSVMNFMITLPDDALKEDVIADDRFLAWVWGWMANAGDELTQDELNALTVDDIEVRASDQPDEDPEESEEASPTSAPTGSARGGSAGEAKPKTSGRSTTTSRRRSATGSS